MAEYGRRRSPAKRVYWETGIEGSNPSLSVNSILGNRYRGFESLSLRKYKRTVAILSFLYLQRDSKLKRTPTD